jgi:hypothetical protein
MGRCGPFTLIVSRQAWLPDALRDGLVPDAIVDANHTIHYLKYATMRHLLTK